MKKVLSILAVAAMLVFVAGSSFGTEIKDDMKFRGEVTLTGGVFEKVVTIVMLGVDYTLSAAEAAAKILNVTGSPSGKAIIAPSVSASDLSRLYTVRNAGSDSGAVTLKKTAGTGVAVAAGKTAEVYWLSTDYVRKTDDATH